MPKKNESRDFKIGKERGKSKANDIRWNLGTEPGKTPDDVVKKIRSEGKKAGFHGAIKSFGGHSSFGDVDLGRAEGLRHSARDIEMSRTPQEASKHPYYPEPSPKSTPIKMKNRPMPKPQ